MTVRIETKDNQMYLSFYQNLNSPLFYNFNIDKFEIEYNENLLNRIKESKLDENICRTICSLTRSIAVNDLKNSITLNIH